jgi:pimeloyl-ACP methyl ester carboxylesterase
LPGIAQLATQATQGIARIAEGVSQSVWGTVGWKSGISSLVFRTIYGANALTGRAVQALLRRVVPLMQSLDGAGEKALGAIPSTDHASEQLFAREAVLAALNGVLGDRLQASGNPLATPMTLRRINGLASVELDGSAVSVSPKVLVFVHGLCMNDLQWNNYKDGRVLGGHAQALSGLGYTPVYLRYNTGLHISENGQMLAGQMAQLVRRWPVKVEEISIVAHSMGGLVARSAVNCARQGAADVVGNWPALLKHLVFLGTPHHGAPLEKAGHWVDRLLGSTPYSRPFAAIGQLRSSGITDLRHGCVAAADWQGRERFGPKPGLRQPVPLPEGVACHAVAGVLASQRSALADRLLGDGLVTLPSALGQHADAHLALQFAKKSQRVFYGTSHMQLLDSPAVTRQLVQWLQAGTSATP